GAVKLLPPALLPRGRRARAQDTRRGPARLRPAPRGPAEPRAPLSAARRARRRGQVRAGGRAQRAGDRAGPAAAREPPLEVRPRARDGRGLAGDAGGAKPPGRSFDLRGARRGSVPGPHSQAAMQAPSPPATLPDFVRAFDAAFGPRPLILLGERRLAYAEAALRSARLARGLLAHGLAKGARVGVWMPNGPDWVLAWLAAARIGCVVVPINTFSKPRELHHVLHHADVHALWMVPRLAGADALARLEACAPSLARAGAGDLVLPELPQLRRVFVQG